jgi:hypothetical protein
LTGDFKFWISVCLHVRVSFFGPAGLCHLPLKAAGRSTLDWMM